MIRAVAADRISRPIWLTTLADLGLLLVGFFVFVQATQHLDKRALANGFRQGFGAPVAPAPADPMPVAAASMPGFAPGSAVLPGPTAGLIAWARAATSDPRVTLRIAGSVDGSAADVDPATGSGAVLAVDRARAIAAALAQAHVAPDRMTIVTAAARRNRREVLVTLGFAGARR